MKRTPTDKSSRYDKIIRENLERLIPSLLEKVLDIHPITVEEIPDDIQRTKERKPDALKRITDQRGAQFILHLEFQVKNDARMVHRMHLYCAMLMEKYSLPIRQYVIYVGSSPMNMIASLSTADLSFRYQLISFQQLDYRLFLTSEKAEEVIFAILGNPGKQKPVDILADMIRRLNETAQSPLLFERHREQLRVLVQLRNLHSVFDTIMDSIAGIFKEENDFLYRRGLHRGLERGKEEGLQKGMEKGMEKGLQKGLQEGLQKGAREKQIEIRKMKNALVINLLTQTDFDNKRIASIADVSVAYVQRIKRDLKNKN